ncbi:MAG: glycosyltransferase [Victivallaceae bacterium]|nr:glycosyltransferase [Victivallaceae bacterium]
MTAIDVILPLYRPRGEWAEHISGALTPLRRALAEKKMDLHLYLVNDGSPAECYDAGSLETIRRAAGNFDFIGYEKNRGKGYCLRYGIARTTGDFQIYTDADFPFGWESVAAAAEALAGGAEIVMGVRSGEYGAALSPVRKAMSGGVRLLNRLLLGLPDRLLDTQAGLKGFNAAGKRAFLATETDGFLFDTEFILLGANAEMKIATVDLHLRPGLHFSRMGLKVMLRELGNFARIMFRVRIGGKMKAEKK